MIKAKDKRDFLLYRVVVKPFQIKLYFLQFGFISLIFLHFVVARWMTAKASANLNTVDLFIIFNFILELLCNYLVANAVHLW